MSREYFCIFVLAGAALINKFEWEIRRQLIIESVDSTSSIQNHLWSPSGLIFGAF
jgi:hypothetical protein